MLTVNIRYFLVSLFIGHKSSFCTEVCNLEAKFPKKRLNLEKTDALNDGLTKRRGLGARKVREHHYLVSQKRRLKQFLVYESKVIAKKKVFALDQQFSSEIHGVL